jgi:protocatechuate 3,4-dioxygenase beta subunit
MEALELQEKPSPEKIKNLKQNFITKIKNRVENQQLIKNLTNRRNSIFSNYRIDLDTPEFRRS